MLVTVNGESRDIPEQTTASQLLEALGLGDERLAMEVNQDIVPRSTFTEHTFSEGDRIEIVRAIGGG
jgi:thiamine biosynthesis protein ThiS